MTQQIDRSNPQQQSSSTAQSPSQPEKRPADTFVPIPRPWGQPDKCPSTPKTTQYAYGGYRPMSRWLSTSQRDQPWNAISSVTAKSFSSHTVENAIKEKNDKNNEKDSERATKGNSSAR